ncbi:MAG: DUF2283 domain-containing protein [Prochlorotrichaceae cyanobacterium]|jgi:uncharacterized protein YuzE
MKIKYDPEADILMVILRDGFPDNAISQPGGVIVSYDENQEPLTLEFLNASQRKLFNPEQRHLTISTPA